MNAIELLTKQHREMESELQAVVDASGDERSALFEKAADSLMAHLLSEEQHFYPAVVAANDAIRVGIAAGYPAPEQRHLVRRSA